MSLLSSILLPTLERELLKLEPEIAAFLLSQLKLWAQEIIEWAETQAHLDLNGDGKIGHTNG